MENPFGDLGPLEPLLADEHVMEIMINGPKSVFVERHGKLEEVDNHFDDEQHLLKVINQIVTSMGRVVDESHPICDVRFADGSRMNVVIPPIAMNGPFVTIRKMMQKPLTVDDLIRYGSFSPELVEFLRACVLARLNIVVAGGTGSGKTTVFNILANFIPADERIVVVENFTELRLQQKHVLTLETRPANVEGRGEITAEDLVINALKMRPDRILLGEARGSEVLHFIQAINTGHDGSMLSMHASSTRDTLARLEVMATMAGIDMPLLTIREQLGQAVNLIVHQERLRDGSRRIMTVTEVAGVKGGEIVLHDIFEFVQTGTKDGRIEGHFTATGLVPAFMDEIEAVGVKLPEGMFTPRQ